MEPNGSASTTSRSSGLRRWLLIGGAAALLLAADQLTKAWAFDELCLVPDGYRCELTDEPIGVVWTLRFNLAFNTGMAFSRGSGAGPIIGLVAVAIVVVLLVVARKLTSRLQLVLVGVVAGGALGNVIDRLVRAEDGFMSGAVVDFIDVQWWPIFNIADSAVVVGGLLLALVGFGADRSHPHDAEAGESADGAPERRSPEDDGPEAREPVAGSDDAVPSPGDGDGRSA